MACADRMRLAQRAVHCQTAGILELWEATKRRMEMETARSQLAAARVRAECWDSMETRAQDVRAFSKEDEAGGRLTLSSFSVSRLPPRRARA